MVAGKQSHGPVITNSTPARSCSKKCLDNVPGVLAVQYGGGWPSDPSAFDNADAILFYMDGVRTNRSSREIT